MRIFFAALLVAASITPTAAKAAGGAYVVDDSEADKPGECQIESWASVARNHDVNAVVSPGCGVKFPIPLEFDATLQRSRSAGDWSSTGALTAKTTFVSTDDGHMVGIGLEATLDATSGSGAGGAIFVPLTIKLGKDWKINLNGGWLYDNAAKVNYATWGAGFEWTFLTPFTLIGEVYGQAGALPAVDEGDPPPNSIRAPRTQIGLRYAPKKNVDLDVIWGHNITGENAHWLTLGVNVRF